MNLRLIGVVMGKDLARGPRNFIFIFAIVVPVVISLVVSLLFGSIFTGKPGLGLADAGNSRLRDLAANLDSVALRQYPSTEALRDAVARGAVDVGIAIPAGFDQRVTAGESVSIVAYVWGESQLQDRAVAGASVAILVRELAGQEAPVEIVTQTLSGDGNIAWQDRLMPFIVLMTILIAGIMLPATMLVEEKQKRTMSALTITPASRLDVYLAKGLIGVILSTIMGVLILWLNQAFGREPLLLTLILFLSAIMAAEIGILLGAIVKDVDTLFATIKGLGVLLYAPAIVYIFPAIPEWIGRLFPTYYMVGPIVEISQRGGSWAEVAPELAILVGLIMVIAVAIAAAGRSVRLQPA